MVLVLDYASSELERIVRFLSEHSNFDIRLVTVSKYSAHNIGFLFVPRLLVTTEGELAPRPSSGPRPMRNELSEVIATYDGIAAADLKTQGGDHDRVDPPESRLYALGAGVLSPMSI